MYAVAQCHVTTQVELLPCPGESDLNAQTKNAKHRRWVFNHMCVHMGR